jgi:hypothetical protein
MSWQKSLFVAVMTLFIPAFASGQEPGWSGQVIAVGQTRREIRSTDILHRPYRPLHFYGNTVRRRYYHGSAMPGVRMR